MEQSATPVHKPRISWLAILSFILSLTPFVSASFAMGGVISIPWSFYLAAFGVAVGIMSGIIFLVRLDESRKKTSGKDLAIASIPIGFILLLVWMLIVPSSIRIQGRSKEAEVKWIAHDVQDCVEDFKSRHGGECPFSVRDMEDLLSTEYVKGKRNPFNSKQTYTIKSGGIVDGDPVQSGVIGYITPQDSSEPYRIVIYTTFPGLGKWDTFQLVEKTTK